MRMVRQFRNLSFVDQFAFRPAASTAAPLIFLLYTITDL